MPEVNERARAGRQEKPFKRHCPKCGGSASVTYFMKDEEATPAYKLRIRSDEWAFVRDRAWGCAVTARRECLSHKCRECGYDWFERTLDDTRKEELPAGPRDSLKGVEP